MMIYNTMSPEEQELSFKYLVSLLPGENDENLELTEFEQRRAQKILAENPSFRESVEIFFEMLQKAMEN